MNESNHPFFQEISVLGKARIIESMREESPWRIEQILETKGAPPLGYLGLRILHSELYERPARDEIYSDDNLLILYGDRTIDGDLNLSNAPTHIILGSLQVNGDISGKSSSLFILNDLKVTQIKSPGYILVGGDLDVNTVHITSYDSVVAVGGQLSAKEITGEHQEFVIWNPA